MRNLLTAVALCFAFTLTGCQSTGNEGHDAHHGHDHAEACTADKACCGTCSSDKADKACCGTCSADKADKTCCGTCSADKADKACCGTGGTCCTTGEIKTELTQ